MKKMKQLIILFAACLLIMETSQAQDSLHQAKPNPSIETYKTPPHMVYSSEYYKQEDENYRLDHDRCRHCYRNNRLPDLSKPA